MYTGAVCVDLAKILKLKSGKEEALNVTPQSHATVIHEEKRMHRMR